MTSVRWMGRMDAAPEKHSLSMIASDLVITYLSLASFPNPLMNNEWQHATYPLSLHNTITIQQVLMTNHDLSIPAPLFVTWFQCLFTVGLCYLFGELGEIQRKKGKAAYFTQFPAMRYNFNVAMKIAVLSVVSK